MKTLIKNVNVVTRDEVIASTSLLIEDDKIALIGAADEADVVIDAEGKYLIPGFVDMHCHGGDGFEFIDADRDGIAHIADFHLSHGTTTMLATTLASPDSERDDAIKNVVCYMRREDNGVIAGLHLEGPWFAKEQCGAQNPVYIRPAKSGELEALFDAYPEIKRISAAPELEGGMELGRVGSARGVLMSAGHTDADFSEIEEALAAGYTLMTHLYSGMKGVTRRNSFRIAGAVEAGLYFDEMNVEIIADGRHLPYELLRYIYKIKGADRICLITDAIRAAGMPDGSMTRIGSEESGLRVIVEDGVAKLTDRQSFAGSTATMDRVYSVMLEATGCGIVMASRMASTNPARLLGFDDRGEIAKGRLADLLLVTLENNKINIEKIIKGGKIL
ncbi:MAG: N-acetylglucosamine-6-phosphate deacetylase [Clostridia bacterium]|nr:N-acetylglucosamine-6-phosphate deacetylase [Clostridia bacterium]